jgi:hypothetical protein
MGKIRFGNLVRESGRPQYVTLWTAPEKDRSVSRGLKEGRILTVLEPPGKTPYGLPGLHRDPHSILLLFPRPLHVDASARVIGINLELAEEPEPQGPLAREHTTSVAKSTKIRKKAEPKTKKFKVRIRRTAIIEEEKEVEALNRKTAERRALESVEGEVFDTKRAAIRNEVL